MTEMKEERLQLRVSSAEKGRLEEAAAAAHLSVSSFVLQAASFRADEVLADRALIHLDRNAATAFAEALEAPADFNSTLLDALQHSPKVQWVD